MHIFRTPFYKNTFGWQLLGWKKKTKLVQVTQLVSVSITLLLYIFRVGGKFQFMLFYVAFSFAFVFMFLLTKNKPTHVVPYVVFTWMIMFSKEILLDLFHYFQFSIFRRKEMIGIAGSMINRKTIQREVYNLYLGKPNLKLTSHGLLYNLW